MDSAFVSTTYVPLAGIVALSGAVDEEDGWESLALVVLALRESCCGRGGNKILGGRTGLTPLILPFTRGTLGGVIEAAWRLLMIGNLKGEELSEAGDHGRCLASGGL